MSLRATPGEARARLFVGLDYLPAVQHAPGVGRYVRELVRALVRRSDAPRLALFEGGLGPRPMEGAPLGLDGALVAPLRRRVPLPRRALAALARLGLGADRLVGRPDLFHRVHPLHPPLSGGLDTLALAELPEVGTALDARIGAAVRGAAGVLVFDASFAVRVTARYDVDPARLEVMPVGAEHWARELPSGAHAREPRTPPEVLVLGAVRRAREPLRVLAAFAALARGGPTARLVLVGRPGDAADAFRRALSASPARELVTWIDAPEERDMPSRVAGATVLLHLAEDEGSPVTPLEAARLGLAVVASDLPAFRAALGDGARWVGPGDGPDAIAAHLAAALEDGADAEHRAAQRRLASPYTWDASAAAHLAAFERILSGRAARAVPGDASATSPDPPWHHR